MIDALGKTLIPGAANAELKALLIKVRPAFVAHLEHAKRLQSSWQRETERAGSILRRRAYPYPMRMGLAAGDQAKPRTHTVTIEGMRFQPETHHRRTRGHDYLGQQGPGSSYGDFRGRPF